MGNIVFDFDGVLVNYFGRFLRYYNERTGSDFKYEDIFSHDLEEVFGIPRKEVIMHMDVFNFSQQYYEIQPVEGAVDLLKRVSGNGNRVYLVTARPYELMDRTVHLIERHFGNVFNGIHYTNYCPKDSMCSQLQADIFIDDHPMNIEQCISNGRKVFMFDQPWNRKCEIPGAVRVKSHGELREKLGV